MSFTNTFPDRVLGSSVSRSLETRSCFGESQILAIGPLEVEAQKIPALLMNARISASSLWGYGAVDDLSVA